MRTSLFLCGALILGFVLPLRAQTFGRLGDIESQGTAYHVYARPGDATVQVLVMGLGSGIYEVSSGTRLDELLALIGGATGSTFGAQSSNMRRTTTLRLYRLNDEERTLLYESSVEEMLMHPGTYPELQDGDLFLVETMLRSRLEWRDALRLIMTTASLILIIDRLVQRF